MSVADDKISALLIAPDRELSDAFLRAAQSAKQFQILSDVKSYLTEQVLEMRLRQWRPEVVLMDLRSDVQQACESIRFLINRTPSVQVVGLHMSQDADAIVRSLRAGATEFLSAPFDAAGQAAAAERIRRLRQPVEVAENDDGTVVAFASTKPGSGASTLAAQIAFAIRRVASKKVLLLDMDLMGGTIGFYLKLQHQYSVNDLFTSDEVPDRTALANLVASVDGVDILPGPDEPQTTAVDRDRLHSVIEECRKAYDFVILDLPAIFQRSSLLGLAEAENAFLVTTAELPSLHLTRKALDMLGVLGFEKNRYGIVLNRLDKEDGIAPGDLEKMLGTPIRATLPNDYFSLHRVVTRGEPLSGDSELSRSIENFAGALSGVAAKPAPKGGGFWRSKSAGPAGARA